MRQKKRKKTKMDILKDFIQFGEIAAKSRTENLDLVTEIEKIRPWNEFIESIEEAKKLLAEEDINGDTF